MVEPESMEKTSQVGKAGLPPLLRSPSKFSLRRVLRYTHLSNAFADEQIQPANQSRVRDLLFFASHLRLATDAAGLVCRILDGPRRLLFFQSPASHRATQLRVGISRINSARAPGPAARLF